MKTLRNVAVIIITALVFLIPLPLVTPVYAATAPVSLRPVFITNSSNQTITSASVGQQIKFVVYVQNNTTTQMTVLSHLQLLRERLVS